MTIPAGWQNPITVQPGQVQAVLASLLLPSRKNLVLSRLDFQRGLRDNDIPRQTPIQVTKDGVIWDGHHGARAFAERDQYVDVQVVASTVQAVGVTILDLPVR